MYDNICKFLAETFPADIATWLLGSPIALTQLNPKELSVEPIRADSLIFLQSQDLILHVEFQTQPKADLPFRMADYRLRAYRRFPEQQMHQVVVYLKPSQSPLVDQNCFEIRRLRHEFEIIRLWEQPVESFLEQPGLFPFAVLAQTQSPETTLRQVAQKIDEIPQQRTQAQISASTYVLAGLTLKQEFIQTILRRDIMRESVTYQAILQEGRQEGLQEGLKRVALNLLKAGMAIEDIVNLTTLSLKEIQALQQQTNQKP